jgi:N-carbamoylputrescine amidase
MAMAGAELLIYPTAIGWDPTDDKPEQIRQRDAWVTVQRAHAVANGVPVVSVNRVGHEADPEGGAGVQFWGNSFVAGPQGEFLLELGVEPTTAVASIDMQRSENVRRIWPFLRDRRIDFYGDLTKLYRD